MHRNNRNVDRKIFLDCSGFKFNMLLLQSCHFTGRFLLLNTLRGTIIILRMSGVIPSILPNVLVAVVEVAALMESFHMELQMLALG